MMGKLTATVLRHRAVVLVGLAAFILAGINAYLRLPVEAYPDVTNVSVQIITLYPGHAAEEVERLVTIPIENVMNGIPQRVSLRSISLFGLSQITLIFEDDADKAAIRNLASQFLNQVPLPAGAQASLSPDSTPIGEIFRYTLKAPEGFPAVEIKALEDWVVEKRFRMVPGIVDVVGFGAPTKQYQVLVDPAKLKSYNLTLQQVFTALANGNNNAGGSYVEHGSELYVVRGLGFVRNLADIGAIAVDTRGGTPVRISDLGRVVIGHAVRLGQVGKTAAAQDEDDVAEGIVLMRRGENPLAVLQRVEKMADQINQRYLPPGVKLVPYYDRTGLTHRTLHTVRKNMLEGISLVLLVLTLFLGLGNYRSALVVALAVPVSLLGAFMLLDVSRIPANLISMGAIDFGIIVDSSVVVIENLLRLLEKRKGQYHSLFSLIVEAVAQMGRPILFSKTILLTAFIPLYTLQRVEGRIFRPMALTLTFALITGTIFAVVVVPALASFAVKRTQHGEAWIVRWLLRLYRPALDFALRSRAVVLAGAVALLAAGGVTFHFLGSEFLPKLDEGELWVRTFFPQSISPSEAAVLTQTVRKRLAAFPEVTYVVSQLGRPDDGTDINGFDVTEYSVGLKPREQWTTAHTRDALCDAMKARLRDTLPGVETQFSQYIEDNVNEAVSGVKSELAIKLYGDDLNQLQTLADRIVEIIKTVPGAKDVGTDLLLGQPQIQIAVDRAAIARFGLSVNDVQTIIATAMGGQAATQVLEGERTFDLVVKLAPQSVADVDAIRNIPVFGSNGERLTLGALASVEVHPGFARVVREENERRTAIKLSVRDRDLGSVVAEAERKVDAAVHLPPGYRLEWTGSFENQQRAERRLAVIVPLTLLAIFFLLFITFNSSKFATLILMNVPYSAAGGLMALPLAGLNLSVAALVGFVALFGISIQNSVILVSRIAELRREGCAVLEAITEGAASRVRPMVMTALMAMLGLLPMALSTGVGAETARPFAVVIIGGLISDTALTLFILPLLYPLFEPALAKPQREA